MRWQYKFNTLFNAIPQEGVCELGRTSAVHHPRYCPCRRIIMLKEIFHLPSSLASDNDRRKQLLNLLLIIFSILAILILAVSLFFMECQCLPFSEFQPALIGAIITIIFNSSLLVANRLFRMPGWLSAMIFVTFLTVLVMQLDAPDAGSGLIFWTLPMLVAALTLRPAFVFLIAGVESALSSFSSIYINKHPIQYDEMLALFVIALLCWLVMTLLQKAVHDSRRQAANMDVILNTIKDGVLVLDAQGNFVSANRALLMMIPEDKLREINNKPLEETLEWKRTVFSVTASLLPEMGSVVVFRDETRRHEADRAKDALLATASHELRTPLSSVMNYIELLMLLIDLGKVNTEKFVVYLRRAHENSRRLLGLVNNILDQAQIQAGGLELKRERCNLLELLEKNRQISASLVAEKDLSYELTVTPNVPEEIISDPERLNQVLNNLIGNAIKFTNQGGIKVKVSQPGKDTLTIEVADTGPGIPDEQLPDIFEVFRRGSNYAQREHQGAGLGLSIVKELVGHMGGEISVASTLGAGSVFTVSLPLMLPEND